jgi:hypothetical protein
MAEVNLLRSLPDTKRNIQKRAEDKDPDVIAVSKQFGKGIGTENAGYGVQHGRWPPCHETSSRTSA